MTETKKTPNAQRPMSKKEVSRLHPAVAGLRRTKGDQRADFIRKAIQRTTDNPPSREASVFV